MASERNYISSHLLAVMHYRQYRTTMAFYGGSFASHQHSSPAADTDYHFFALVGISEEHPNIISNARVALNETSKQKLFFWIFGEKVGEGMGCYHVRHLPLALL